MLAFMLTDEMTTGSVASSDLEKRKYAASSHAFNINEAKFQEAFPEASLHLGRRSFRITSYSLCSSVI